MCAYIWSNYSDLTRPHPKWWFSKGNPLISGKSTLVKYYNLSIYIYICCVHIELSWNLKMVESMCLLPLIMIQWKMTRSLRKSKWWFTSREQKTWSLHKFVVSVLYIYIFMNDRFLLENPNELHPRKLTCPLKGGHFKRKVVFQPIFFSEDMFVLGGGCQKEAVFAVVHNDRAPFKTVNPPKKFQSRWFWRVHWARKTFRRTKIQHFVGRML